MKRSLLLIAAAGIAVLVIILFWRENRRWDGPVQKVSAGREQIERGRYLAKAADCVACHTATDGIPFAGGYPLDTPYGTVYGSNITPSADYGIGRWTKEQFYTALTKGVAPGGRHLYPVMPYTSYKGISRQDSDDIYAYLMTSPAVDSNVPANELNFPFNLRVALIGWNLLFHNQKPLLVSSTGTSAVWQRGRYLVDGLGHCGECHTPRGMFGQMQSGKTMQGGTLGRFASPDITPQGLAQRGWTPQSLAQFLSTGLSSAGSAFSEMFMVVDRSTRYLTEPDLNAMVTYLMGEPPPPALQVVKGQGKEEGRFIYLTQCSGCHGNQGEGKPHISVAMINNSTLRQPDGRNLLVAVIDGLDARNFPNRESRQSMPSFNNRLNDEQIAALANYLRATWAGLPESITADQVKALRPEK